MVNSDNLKDALVDVRKAHRLIASYQQIMLSLIFFIKNKLGFQGERLYGEKRFSNPLSGRWGLNVWPDMWPWDFLYSYEFEYRFGSKSLPDGSKVFLSVTQISDTGYYDSESNDEVSIKEFKSPEDSFTKLLFLMEHAPAGKPLAMESRYCQKVTEILNSKEYCNSSYESKIISSNEDQTSTFLLYSVHTEKFFNEDSTITVLQDYLSFLKENGIDLKLV